MSAEEELFRRLTGEGLPASEAPELLRRVEAKRRAKELARLENPFKFIDKRLQRLSDIWFSQRETVTDEQKNKVALSYISKVLDLGDEVASDFAERDQVAMHEVGRRQGGLVSYTPDLRGFWGDIRTIFADTYTQEDLEFLVSEGNIQAVWQFINQIPTAETRTVLSELSDNLWAY